MPTATAEMPLQVVTVQAPDADRRWQEAYELLVPRRRLLVPPRTAELRRSLKGTRKRAPRGRSRTHDE